jgi:hypothetical protein
MAARGATDAQRAKRVRIGRATGSHSVDRVVRVLYFCYEETPNRDVFIDLFPVNPNPWADKSPVGSLCRG